MQGQTSLLLTKAAQVHNLKGELTPQAKVHLLATVTYYDPLDYDLFVQDDSGGVFVSTTHPYPIHSGDLVEIDGGAEPGYRSEVATNPMIRVVGRGHMPDAPKSDYAAIVTGREDCLLVTVKGVVRSADLEQHENGSYAHMDLGVKGGKMEVYLGSSTGFDPDRMFGKEIEVKAIAGGVFDARQQLTGLVLYVQDVSGIRILRTENTKNQQLPLTDIDRIFEAQRIDDASQRIRVRGAVTYYRKGNSAVLERDGKGVYVQTRETQDLAIGDVVDAYGYPSDREYAPSLREATLVKTGGHEQIEPRAVSYSEAQSGIYSDNLLSLSGILVAQLHDHGSDVLVMNVDGHLVNSSLQNGTSFPRFPLGSRIRIAGVCRILPGGPWRSAERFFLQMRSIADAQLISEPSWWTVQHLFGVLGALIVLALIIFIWAVLLKIRVRQQTEQINRSMLIAKERSRVFEKISSNRDLDELLSEICESIKRLLPGYSCFYSLRGEVLQQRAHERVYFEMPLSGDAGKSIGKIVVTGPEGLDALEDQQLVYSTLSELATFAIERSLLHEQLVHHSTHDPLTELPNRRLCDSKLQMALEDAIRKNNWLAVIYIDVDCFKEVNDQYGHKTGDLYLQQISSRLQAHMRTADTLARIGGDEFLLIVPVPSLSHAAESLMKRLRSCFDDPFLLDGHKVKGSASFGLAIYPEHGTTAEELKRNADQAMYHAKKNLELPCQPFNPEKNNLKEEWKAATK